MSLNGQDGCCHSPDDPVIEPDEKTLRMRSALLAIAYGDVGSAIGRAYIFGFSTAVVHLASIWIDYTAYASMHYLWAMGVCFLGGVEAVMYLMNAHDGGPLEAAINRSPTTLLVFYVSIAFALTKMISAAKIQQAY